MRTLRCWSSASIGLSLFVLALAVRWQGLAGQTHQMWGDEAQFMTFARNFIQGEYTSPFIADGRGLPALYDLALSGVLRLVGQMDVTAARAFSGLLGALSVPLLYSTAVELGYPRRVGIVAAVTLATTFWDVSFSRLVLPNIMGVSATSATVLLLVMAVRRSNLSLAALAGLAVAWACNAHLVGMMAVPLVGGWVALLALGYSRWWSGGTPETAGAITGELRGWRARRGGVSRWLTPRGNWQGDWLDLNNPCVWPRLPQVLAVSVVCGVVALMAAWPLLQLYFGAGSAVQGHATSRYIFSPENRTAFAASHPAIGADLLNILWYQFTYAVGIFTIRGQPGGVFNLDNQPLLDPVSGPLFVVGVATALWMWQRPAAVLVLLWLAVPVVLGTMLTIDPTWSFHRSVTAAPAMCMLIALGLETALLTLRRVLFLFVRQPSKTAGMPPWWSALRLVAVTLVAITIGVQGIQHYWTFANAPMTIEAFDNGTHEWALFLASHGALPVTVVGPNGWPVEFPTLYAPKASICAGQWSTTWQHCPPARIVIFVDDAHEAQRYAEATHLPVHMGSSPDGIAHFWYAQGQSLPDPAHVLAHVL